MTGYLDYFGYGLAACVAAYAVLSLLFMARRNQFEAAFARGQAEAFQRRVALELDQAQQVRERELRTWDGYRKFEVAEVVDEALDVRSVYMRPRDGKPLPPFKAGQHLAFRFNVPGQDKPVIRCYSLSDAPTDRTRYRISVKRQGPPPNNPDVPPGVGSNYVHSLEVGDLLDVRAPGGSFFLPPESDHPIVLLAGGVGLTPMLSMLNYVTDNNQQRETWLFFGIRNKAEHMFADHMRAVAAQHENVTIVNVYGRPTDDCVEGHDYQAKGYVSADLLQEMLPSLNYDFYMCGPPPMMSSLFEGLRERGVPEARIHFEAFGPASVKKTAPPPAAATATPAEGVEVIFARSSKTVTWKGENQSLLELAEESGVAMSFGCRAGSCGECATAIKDGKVRYLTEPGFTPETGSCLACCSVPDGRLTIDA
ncbi:MAG: 2Fe-2S iron-sulfur cluster binding domain-containing protein [Alphaproteobacteria bacterium]|nr:2Fe-2S iron-sulfur cluster binding domain-containing protein [Alphaproteobacteria bacterium]MCB9931031.1 2Fe-2S iron-sulfur cluster binding domain-containing protein [Alphaproteobacteria bacterium]